jgi:hypothetical protein
MRPHSHPHEAAALACTQCAGCTKAMQPSVHTCMPPRHPKRRCTQWDCPTIQSGYRPAAVRGALHCCHVTEARCLAPTVRVDSCMCLLPLLQLPSAVPTPWPHPVGCMVYSNTASQKPAHRHTATGELCQCTDAPAPACQPTTFSNTTTTDDHSSDRCHWNRGGTGQHERSCGYYSPPDVQSCRLKCPLHDFVATYIQ